MNAKTTKVPILVFMAICVTVLAGCSETVTDFGYDGQISGMILDQNGNPVSGDVSNAALTVFVLGEEDRVPLELRVNGDGSYANLQLYPQSYEVWIDGPVDAPGRQTVDLTGDRVEHNITVTPFLAISEPSASISGGDLQVTYDINPSQGHAAEERIVLVSTVAKVGVNTGSGARWQTRAETVSSNSGTATITLDDDLLSMAEERGGGNLHVRVAARSDQTSDWNYSVPIVVEAP
ncbi:DUF3823 domain-containing protein [Aliifodinibius sp. S!AR15-10]|uniref:hypothetical protein n=1 Tax=Aliifodinibius sp. S!AR15-10 TaxID=2950437 RepID=UPI002863A30E|nr:hypothetical protein [Aliifodinibius sp. S!AR15-10]MDR8389693.1 DUF3823 domain-containing protein [Aliifodinibius sp. S!AR15-10]